MLGGEVIVSAAADAEVGWLITAAEAARFDVVVLEPGAALAAHAVRADPGAAKAVSFEHGTASRAG